MPRKTKIVAPWVPFLGGKKLGKTKKRQPSEKTMFGQVTKSKRVRGTVRDMKRKGETP